MRNIKRRSKVDYANKYWKIHSQRPIEKLSIVPRKQTYALSERHLDRILKISEKFKGTPGDLLSNHPRSSKLELEEPLQQKNCKISTKIDHLESLVGHTTDEKIIDKVIRRNFVKINCSVRKL